jgi:hypothetical protein
MYHNFRVQRKLMNVPNGCLMAGMWNSEPEKVAQIREVDIRWL